MAVTDQVAGAAKKAFSFLPMLLLVGGVTAGIGMLAAPAGTPMGVQGIVTGLKTAFAKVTGAAGAKAASGYIASSAPAGATVTPMVTGLPVMADPVVGGSMVTNLPT